MKIYWNGNSKNIIGPVIRRLRKEQGYTQSALAARMQLRGFDVSDLTILRIENGTRFVPDYEVKALAEILNVSYETLLGAPEHVE
ncbi:MAG: helix-turn-helix transcriptional regulator [Oscillospiraceae bacterium]|nr:helix-turn-helix transcriptional regulator [Oscillospiraceae bacterium]